MHFSKDLMRWSAVVWLALLTMAQPLAAQTAEQWQRAAVQKYPALAQAGSPLNQKFLAIVAAKRTAEPAYFTQPDWPMRAVEEAVAALRAEEMAVAAKKAEEEKAAAAKLAEMSPDEQAWEREKERWVFERLVFGDDDGAIAKKLYASKLITARVPPGLRAPLSSRFWWVIGESKYYADFETKDGLVAIVFESLAEPVSALPNLVNDDWKRLREAVVERFGAPAKSVEFPSGGKLHLGGWTVTDTWERPGFRMKLGITEDGGKCSAALRISDPAKAAE